MRFLCFFLLFLNVYVTAQEQVKFLPTGGVYSELKEIKLIVPNGFHVYYTTDGMLPTSADIHVKSTVFISKNTTFLFAVYSPE